MHQREQVLIDHERWYTLTKDGRGQLFLEVVRGGVAMDVVVLPLSSDEARDYERIGKSFLDIQALRVLKWPERYPGRLTK